MRRCTSQERRCTSHERQPTDAVLPRRRGSVTQAEAKTQAEAHSRAGVRKVAVEAEKTIQSVVLRPRSVRAPSEAARRFDFLTERIR